MRRVCGALLMALIATPCAFAAQELFVPTGLTGARAAALGGAEMALPGTAESIFSNPAGLSQLVAPEISAGFGAAEQREEASTLRPGPE